MKTIFKPLFHKKNLLEFSYNEILKISGFKYLNFNEWDGKIKERWIKSY